MQTIYLDISNKGVMPTIYAKQGDVGRKFTAVITDAGKLCDLADSAFSVWYTGTSGEGNYTDIGDNSAFSVDGNTVTVELITQMLTNTGSGVLCLVMSTAEGGQLGTWNIPYHVEGVPGSESEEAQQYYTAFQRAVADLPYPDASLSVAGKAADAAAVGETFKSKAPVGLVSRHTMANPTTIDDTLNEFVDSMEDFTTKFFSVIIQTQTIPVIMPTGTYLMRAYRVGNYNAQVMAWNTDNTIMVKELNGTVVDGTLVRTWSAWEWANPTMENGIEYRTTERWNGKTVYAKAISCGALPNTNTKTVSWAPDSGTCESVVDYGGTTVGYGALPNHFAGIHISVNAANIFIETAADRSSGTAVVWVKYTKV